MSGMAIKERKNVPAGDKWKLDSLFSGPEAWEEGLKQLEVLIPKITSYKGTLGDSAPQLRSCLEFFNELEILEERLGYYAMLRKEEDVADSESMGRFSRYMSVATKSGAEASFLKPEIQALSDETLDSYMNDPVLEDFRISLERLIRYKPHILSEKEETLLAMQAESAGTARKAFSALTNGDMNFGSIEVKGEERELTNSSFGVFLLEADRDVRKKAFHQFYEGFESHKNTLSELLGGSVLRDIYTSKVRGFTSAREASLFPDNVPVDVYDNLVASVSANLEPLHRYYALRKKVLGLDELHLYDTKVSLIQDVKVKHSYDDAVEVVLKALSPLGELYGKTLGDGLKGGWVDRYENKGKRSGAFSAGSYKGDPYILLNFKEDDIRDVFTLAHEGGHSMHSWYSVRNNPFQNYNYTIFEAEVASTFNEQLLGRYLMDHSTSREMTLYLLGRQIDDALATIYRQTMFAEYEHLCHKNVEAGEPLTVDSLRSEYRKLLEKYFGPHVVLDEVSDLEGLRIPHFYSAFYVYKYATGLSAAMALSERVLEGGDAEREDYMNFLKSGGSRFPLDSLAAAGVDMSRPDAVNKALARFASLVDQLEKELLG
ncbi:MULTISPECIES: oligoendopeptidase F [unclassified Oceanispirochaeta]|uniref:oligoendopeptidase F n=1 Tax=unclassified Oceanispirochaeta TaxID=2635722 RepID=UPI000E09A963|nr:MULTISPECIES: oligoendopeptidase F [unclassified Oceanispirochaeta]MBF9018060.1 oligoendopeptidase F [Oceanispirochaeta sp. M2]NPD73859.1 oligoendopeptidase F [Oceanispirochaeta sp. M1]RDG30320.1 oligoendopeptidase F [Oceanispirochaeta sp. M1]